METVGWVDLGVAAVVLLSAIFAFYRGFMREVLAIAGWVGAAVFAFHYYGDVRPHIEPYLKDELLTDVATAAGLFLSSLVVFWLVIHFIVNRVKKSALNALDRSLGFVFGVARGVVVVALAFMLGETMIWPPEEHSPPGDEEHLLAGDEERPRSARPEWVSGARSLPLIKYAANTMKALLPEKWKKGLKLPFGDNASTTEVSVEDLREPIITDPEATDEGALYGEADLDQLIDSVQDDAGEVAVPAPAAGDGQ